MSTQGFKRGIDPKKAMGLGKMEGKNLILGDLSTFTSKNILPGISARHIYIIRHPSSSSVIGVCCGRKVVKVLKKWMSESGFGEKWVNRWVWEPNICYYGSDPRNRPHPRGGYLRHKYTSAGEENMDKSWTESISCDISFSYSQDMIIEL